MLPLILNILLKSDNFISEAVCMQTVKRHRPISIHFLLHQKPIRERFIEKKEEKKQTNVCFALSPTYVQ